jgi:hypothetical protein
MVLRINVFSILMCFLCFLIEVYLVVVVVVVVDYDVDFQMNLDFFLFK